MDYVNPDILWSPADLGDRMDEPKLVVLDMRPAEAYANGHIPGARSFDIFGISLIDTRPQPLEAFLWIIEHLLAQKGVSDESVVMAYDDISGMRAARLFWFLEYFGHDDTHVLNGGFRAWQALGLPVTRDATIPKASSFRSHRRRELLATADDVLDRLREEGTAIVDTRSRGEHMGETVRAARGGAIPGAIHIEWTHNLRSDGAFKPADELEALYRGRNIGPEREVIPYCQGGYRSAHTYLTLRLIGYPRVRNYLGSWGEWGNRTELPIEKP